MAKIYQINIQPAEQVIRHASYVYGTAQNNESSETHTQYPAIPIYSFNENVEMLQLKLQGSYFKLKPDFHF